MKIKTNGSSGTKSGENVQITLADGHFKFKVESYSDDSIFRIFLHFDGFKSLTTDVSLGDNKDIVLNFILEPIESSNDSRVL